jgi:hypothetical protein
MVALQLSKVMLHCSRMLGMHVTRQWITWYKVIPGGMFRKWTEKLFGMCQGSGVGREGAD